MMKSRRITLVLAVIMGVLTFATSIKPALAIDPQIPGSMLQDRVIKVKASDNINGNINCASTFAATFYGPLAHCIQFKPGTASPNLKARTGYYNDATKIFTPNGGWMDVAGDYMWVDPGSGQTSNCYNYTTDNKFKSAYSHRNGILQAGPYGPLTFGQRYRYNNGVWQIKWGQQDHSSFGDCYNWGEWMNAFAW